MKRLAWVTDIHLDFLERPEVETFFREIAVTGADAVLVGGDIADAATFGAHLRALAEAVSRPVYFVLGNHDFYGGSIAAVRREAEALSKRGGAVWLPAAGFVALSETTALVGHDGWGDGRLGNPETTPVVLTDFALIADLARLPRRKLLDRVRGLGDEAGSHLRRVMREALERFQEVVVLTHVPPFREACWHEGKISDDDWLPWFTCKAAGDALLEAARGWPGRKIAVLCGHTHGSGEARLAENLVVRTGGAVYGKPAVQAVVEVG